MAENQFATQEEYDQYQRWKKKQAQVASQPQAPNPWGMAKTGDWTQNIAPSLPVAPVAPALPPPVMPSPTLQSPVMAAPAPAMPDPWRSAALPDTMEAQRQRNLPPQAMGGFGVPAPEQTARRVAQGPVPEGLDWGALAGVAGDVLGNAASTEVPTNPVTIGMRLQQEAWRPVVENWDQPVAELLTRAATRPMAPQEGISPEQAQRLWAAPQGAVQQTWQEELAKSGGDVRAMQERLRQERAARPDLFFAEKGFGEALLDPMTYLPLGPAEVTRVGQLAAQGVRKLAPEGGRVLRAADAFIQKPEVQAVMRKITPGLGLEDVTKASAIQQAVKLPERARKYGVGKDIGGAVYVHKTYEDVLPDAVAKAKQALPENYDYQIVKYDKNTGDVSFIQSPDFDTAAEPMVGDGMLVKADGTRKALKNPKDDPWIYHHKWLFVGDDYPGFDVAAARQHSTEWMQKPGIDYSRIGKRSTWEKTIHEASEVGAEPGAQATERRHFAEKTPRPQIAALLKQAPLEPGTVNVDVGGGPFPLGTDYLAGRNVENIVLDDLALPAKHNDAVIARLSQAPADTATVANVLNTIENPQARLGVIAKAAKYTKPGGKVYFSVYYEKGGVPGIRGTGQNATWQEMRPLATYLDEIRQVFPDAQVRGNYIEATRPETLPSALAERTFPLYTSPSSIGAVTGAAIGSTQGDTPEERLRNAALYGTAGFLAAPGVRAFGKSLASKGMEGPFSNVVRATAPPTQSANTANRVLGQMYEEAAKPAGPGALERAEQARTALVRAMTDRDVDLAKFQAQAERAKGAPLTADEMLYELKRLNPDKAAEIHLQENLAPALKSVGDDQSWLSVYLTHQDNIDVANAMGNQARRFSGGLSAADSQQALADMATELGPQRMAQIQAAAQQVQDFGRQLLARKRDAGLITPQLYNDLTTMYPHYVPTRITDYMKEPLNIPLGKSLSVRDTGLRRNTVEGTVRAREDPLASMVRNAYESEALARKNEAFNAFVKLKDMDPALQAQVRSVPDSYTATRNEAKVTGFVNGVRQTYVVPKILEQVIKGEPGAVIPGFAGALWGTMMGTFRAMATSRNPVFLASNATLDAATYAVRESMRAGGPQNLPKILSELAGAYVDAFRGVLQGTYHGDTARFLKGGGGQFGFFQGTPGEARATLDALKRSNVFSINGIGDVKRLVKDLVTLKPIEGLGERIELAPRVASFRLAEKAGANPVKAVINGRTVTMDFAQGGNVAKVINQFVPFFNVGMQAPAQISRAFKENPKGFIASTAALLAGPTLTAEAWNRSDPQRAKDYDDVPQYLKDQGIVIMLPGEAPKDAAGNRKPQFVHIRLREYAPFAILAREAAQRAIGDDPRSWGDMIKGVLGSVSPIQGNNAADTLSSFSPLGVSTGLQLTTNQDYFRGGQIATQRADERASALSKAIADASGFRPSQVEFAARDVGSGVAGAVLAASDLAMGQQKDTGTPQGLPGVGGLYGRFVKGTTGNRLDKARNNLLSDANKSALKTAGVTLNLAPVGNTVEGVPLLMVEEEKYQTLVNRYTDEAVKKALSVKSWGKLNPDQRTEVVKDLVQAARDRAGAEVLKSIGSPEIKKRLAGQKKG